MLNHGRVVFRRWGLWSVPVVLLQPSKPVATDHVWVVMVKPVRFAVRPFCGSLDQLVTGRDARPQGSTGT